LEPGVVGVDADPGLDKIEELVPDVLLRVALSPDLSSRYHRIGKSQSRAISTGVNKLWKAKLCPKASRFGVRARTGKIPACPYGFPRGLSDLHDHVEHLKTGRILAHCPCGSKRKVYEDLTERSHVMHNFSTS
jgi:hypothetical protein